MEARNETRGGMSSAVKKGIFDIRDSVVKTMDETEPLVKSIREGI